MWKDSCVEFFFAPGDAAGAGYLNLEMNCGGTMLFYRQSAPFQDRVPVAPEDLERLLKATTLPPIVDPERAGPVTWLVDYRLPFALVARYCPSMKWPAPGVTWRANFYKFAEHVSHPHWLTWAPIDHPTPNFHLPECFGIVRFGT